jgi:hypothetical protein
MFRSIRRASLAALITIFSLAAAASPAHADSFTVTTVSYSHNESFVGIDSAGDFVVNVTNTLSYFNPTCGGVAVSPYTQCFETFYVGQSSPVFSTTVPNLTYDNGTPCTPNAGGSYLVLNGRCNNGYEIFGGYSGPTRGVWAGNDPILSFLNHGSFDGGFINSSGDAVFLDGLDNTLIFVENTTPNPIPEPASWLLLGSGAIAFVGALRRKANRRFTL